MDEFLRTVDYIYSFITSNHTLQEKKNFLHEYELVLDIHGENGFLEKYYKFAGGNKESGIVYTPEYICKFMVESLIKEKDVIENPYMKILEPSCGCGTIVISCFKHLKNIFVKNMDEINRRNDISLTRDKIEDHIIKNNLYGYDVDKRAVKILKIELFRLTGITNLSNFKIMDFLICGLKTKFDLIIGNPPYIGHKSVNRKYFNLLKKKYKKVYKNKADVSYCFFAKAIGCMKNKARLCFIVSRYICESPNALKIREMILNDTNIHRVVDFYGIRPFRNVGIDPVIIFLENSCSNSLKSDYLNKIQIVRPVSIDKHDKSYSVSFFNEEENSRKFLVQQSILKAEGWVFIDEDESEILNKIKKRSQLYIEDICDSHQGIITGCDKAFIVDEKTLEDSCINRDIVKPWIKNSDISRYNVKSSKKYIICTNMIRNETVLETSIEFMEKYRKKLENRRECRKGIRKWYEIQWFRNPEIFDGKKIIFPYKASENRFAIDCGSYFSADVYCITIKDKVPLEYETLLDILNSDVYEFYFKTFAKKLGGNMYEYYPNKVMKLRLPYPIPKFNFRMNPQMLYDFFGFTEREVKIIKENVTRNCLEI